VLLQTDLRRNSWEVEEREDSQIIQVNQTIRELVILQVVGQVVQVVRIDAIKQSQQHLRK
jgi:hypothetical protein